MEYNYALPILSSCLCFANFSRPKRAGWLVTVYTNYGRSWLSNVDRATVKLTIRLKMASWPVGQKDHWTLTAPKKFYQISKLDILKASISLLLLLIWGSRNGTVCCLFSLYVPSLIVNFACKKTGIPWIPSIKWRLKYLSCKTVENPR